MADEVAQDFPPLGIRVYKDGKVERSKGTEIVPASTDPATGVQSNDVVIDPAIDLTARLYLPRSAAASGSQKLPLLIYLHGGGFCIETAFSPSYHNYLNSVAAEANVVVLSVNYRLAPEHHLPIAYDDSWATIQWAASHSTNHGPEAWLNEYADFNRVFFAGDSAGGNLAHNMAVRVGTARLDGFKLIGIILVHPYFWGKDPVGNEPTDPNTRGFVEGLWFFTFPSSSGCDDPLMNPGKDPKLSGLGCEKVLVFVAEQDILKHRGWFYKAELEKSGWGGAVEVVEDAGENHVFHLFKPSCDNAKAMLKRVAHFMNEA